jgi:hypothetical protein
MLSAAGMMLDKKGNKKKNSAKIVTKCLLSSPSPHHGK